ncbi:UDP-glucosyltransferase 2-like isoform X2 [Adelges cooleyi]|uniref:UDP-glucosyltransferase 2-like isoform X2 n=1 Tax=Adelges cooleyi TaxID=133065 RepID=UPI00217F6072|nr:UDP-glucosyltransferase 2-like isoform X2 [Adelges cooleyi]
MSVRPVSTVVVFCALAVWHVAPVTECARILAVAPVAGKSHWNFMSAVLGALTDRGHNVTVFTPFPEGDRPNYTEVDMSNVLPNTIGVDVNPMLKNQFEDSILPVSILPITVNYSRYMCNLVYADERMKTVLRSGGPHYDAVLVELISTDCVSYVATVLKLPMIHVTASPVITNQERSLFGHVSNPAVITHLLDRVGRPRTLYGRFKSLLLHAYTVYLFAKTETKLKNERLELYDRVELVKPSMTFFNTHYVTEPSRSWPPNIIQIGGIHLSSSRTIPSDILEFIENSPHGVIYFTFGSVVSMSTLPDHIQKAFKEALAQVPQRVLWKYEGEMKDKPANVMTSKWFPQRDILLHPNVKLFISHGGISGVYEAVDAGVPVLGFPLFYDQPRNIENLVEAGMAISLDLLKVTKKPFLDAVTELINNKSYAENAKITSERFKDRPMTPAESVVYWTEYVIRHKGAPHLRSHALDLTWYQYFLLDVIAALLLALSIAGYVAYKVLKLIYSLASGQLLKNTKHKAE